MEAKVLIEEFSEVSVAGREVKVIELPVHEREDEFVFDPKPAYEFFKRVFDIICSFAALVVTGPVLLIIMLLIYISDGGNPIFVQERVGKDGKLFKMYKLRTMVVGAEKWRGEILNLSKGNPTILHKNKNDPRITKMGRFLRRISLDEFPQLLNVFKGEMSIIGPRPLIPLEHEVVSEYLNCRAFVKPGLSCYSVLDEHSRDSYERWVEWDLKYITERSFIIDFKIILGTLGVLALHKNF